MNPHTDMETLTTETGDVRSTYLYTGYGNDDATGFIGKDRATATGGPEAEAYDQYRFNSKRWDPGHRRLGHGLPRLLARPQQVAHPRHVQGPAG